MFDQKKYWLQRHKRMRGKLGSVALIGAPEGKANKASEQFQDSIRRIIETLSKKGGITEVLDLGCGIGRAANPILDSGVEYTGVDISPEAIEDAKASVKGGKFVVSDLLEFEPEKAYDVIFASWVLVHFVEDLDWERMLKKIANMMSSAGIFILIDVMSDKYKGPRKNHFKNRPIGSYEKILEKKDVYFDRNLTQEVRQSGLAGVVAKNLYLFRRKE